MSLAVLSVVLLSITNVVEPDAVLLLSVSSNAGLPSDEAAIAKRLADELAAEKRRVSRAVTFAPECATDARCVDDALSTARAAVGIRCDVVRAGPVAQISLQLFAHGEGLVLSDERVVSLDELHRGTALLPTSFTDALRARAPQTPEREPAATTTPLEPTRPPKSDPTTTSDAPATSTPAQVEASEDAFPVLGAVGLGVATLGALLAVTGGGILAMELQVLSDPSSLAADKELATLLGWSSIALLATAVVVTGAGAGIALFGFLPDDADP